MPTDNWVVFTIVDANDVEFVDEAVQRCLDNCVNHTCSAGQLAQSTELTFDLEIVNRAIAEEAKTGHKHDYELSACTTGHRNFSEGFWFATCIAYHSHKILNKVVCVDFTKKGVKTHLKDLITKINKGWLPSDKEFEEPIYDEKLDA